jgi:hypothetical protein
MDLATNKEGKMKVKLEEWGYDSDLAFRRKYKNTRQQFLGLVSQHKSYKAYFDVCGEICFINDQIQVFGYKPHLKSYFRHIIERVK